MLKSSPLVILSNLVSSLSGGGFTNLILISTVLVIPLGRTTLLTLCTINLFERKSFAAMLSNALSFLE